MFWFYPTIIRDQFKTSLRLQDHYIQMDFNNYYIMVLQSALGIMTMSVAAATVTATTTRTTTTTTTTL